VDARDLYIGLMSGTSLDGVDGVLVEFSASSPHVVAYQSASFPPELRSEFLALNSPGHDELHRAALAGNSLARIYATVVQSLLKQADVSPREVAAIGAHGQTVRHRPGEFDGIGYTLQVNQPALLAELCDIRVVADFRSRDIAAGGQGAPLVPPFHAEFFGRDERPLAILNIGGISNLTLLRPSPGTNVLGFDCGPGNALMDAWCFTHKGQLFDDRGAWASGGTVNTQLLGLLKSEPFLNQPPPKSTGRDLFNASWLQTRLDALPEILAAQDVQATLLEFTAQACSINLVSNGPNIETVVVCGGGALNDRLLARISDLLGPRSVVSSSVFGLPPLQVEATAFAWLARQAVLGRTASLKSITGARGARILGCIYPA
jgi:anhydro-N-acetylmuramic acid kinase